MNTLFKSLTLASLVVASPSFADDLSRRCIKDTDRISVYQSADLVADDLCSASLNYGARISSGRLEVHRRGKRGGRCGKGREVGSSAKTVNVTPDSVDFVNNKGKVVKRISIPESGRGQGVYAIMRNDANFVVFDNNNNLVWATNTTEDDCP